MSEGICSEASTITQNGTTVLKEKKLDLNQTV